MTPAALVDLALAAETDDDARLVLADAIEETPWLKRLALDHDDEPLADLIVLRMALLAADDPAAHDAFVATLDRSEWQLPAAFVDRHADPAAHARAVAALLLFGGWPTRWALAHSLNA